MSGKRGPELLPISQAAALLGVHPNTLRAWSDKGLVPHVRLPSGYRRFTPAQIDQIRGEMGLASNPSEHVAETTERASHGNDHP